MSEIMQSGLPALKVVSGSPVEAYEEINRLLTDYFVDSYHWAVVKDELVLSALMVNKSEILAVQLAMGTNQFPWT